MSIVIGKYCPFNNWKNCVKECQLYQNGGCAIANSATALIEITKMRQIYNLI